MAVDVYVYHPERGLEIFDSMDALNNLPEDATTWVDLETDDAEELGVVARHFELHELTVEDCLDVQHTPKLEDYGRYVFMIFRGLVPIDPRDLEMTEEGELAEGAGDEEDEVLITRGVAMYLSEKYIITHRTAEVPWLDAFLRQTKRMPERTLGQGPAVIAHRVIDVLIDRFLRALGDLEKVIDSFEDLVIETPEEFDLGKVLEVKRGLSSLRQVMRDQRGVISRLAHEGTLIEEGPLRRYFRDIEDHAAAIIKQIDKQIDALTGVRDVYFAMANVRLGDIMRILAVITTIAVPLNLVVGMYGMNFEDIPLLHEPYGFWLILAVSLMIGLFMLVFFRRKRWI